MEKQQKNMEKKKRILSEEHKKKIKDTLLKRVSEGKQKGLFKKGIVPHYTGKKMPKWARDNMSKGRMGMKLSEEHKKNIAMGNTGKFFTDKRKKNISDSLKGKHCSPSTEFKKGHKLPEESRKKIGEANKGNSNLGKSSQYKKGNIPYMTGRKHKKSSIDAYKEKRKGWKTPVKDTKIEVKIQNFLTKMKMNFYTHHYMNIKHGYQCDILIPSKNVVIECDGDYWHNYPTGRDIDHIRTSELVNEGFKVLRLWEFEIKEMEITTFKKKLKEVVI